MPSKLIELEDGTLVEIDKPTGAPVEIAGGAADRIKASAIDKIKPIAEAWQKLNKDMQVQQAELKLGLGFEAEGNLYITKAKGNTTGSQYATTAP